MLYEKIEECVLILPKLVNCFKLEFLSHFLLDK